MVSAATMASAVGIDGNAHDARSEPLFRARTSCCIARESPTIRRAHSSTRSPSGVKLWKREPRLTSSTPSVSSSCLMPADKVGWVTPQASAARPKCCSRASAMRNSSLSIKARLWPKRTAVEGRLRRQGLPLCERRRKTHFRQRGAERPECPDLSGRRRSHKPLRRGALGRRGSSLRRPVLPQRKP